MNKVLAIIVIASLSFTSCGFLKNKAGKGNSTRNRGEIIANKTSKSWSPIRPVDMIPIPSGAFVMGQTDYDFTQQGNAPIKTVTVSGFFMEETEVTNAKYRIFINEVKDSIVRWNLAEKAMELGYTGNEDADGEGGLADYAFKDPSVEDPEAQTAYYEFIQSQNTGRDGGYDEQYELNWDVPLVWDKNEYPDVEYTEVLESMYYSPEERFDNERLIDVRKLNYKYSWIDTQAAAKAKGEGNRSDYIRENEVNVYPDTTVWVNDFEYAQNDPMHENYFSHDAFVDYPVIGVTWDQANAYCAFKTKKHNRHLNRVKKKKNSKVLKYRLPNESEWEYAARGGIQNAPYPWGGPHLTDDRGCYLANFKPKRGDYIESRDEKSSGYLYTSPVKTYPPNEYGLYDMAGNVAEWTASSYNNASYQTTSTLNPSLGAYSTGLKVVRGGSWKDLGYLLMVSSRDFEEQDSARSFIGFRTAQTIPEGAKVRFRKIK